MSNVLRPGEVKRLGDHPVVARVRTGSAALEITARDSDGGTAPGPVPQVRLKAPTRERFDDAGLTDTIGRERFDATVEEAVDACAASMNNASRRSVDPPPTAH